MSSVELKDSKASSYGTISENGLTHRKKGKEEDKQEKESEYKSIWDELESSTSEEEGEEEMQEDLNSSDKVRWRFVYRRRDLIIVLSYLAFAAVVMFCSLYFGLPIIREKERMFYNTNFSSSPSPLSLLSLPYGIVNSDICSDIGMHLSELGGNAVDCAIGMSLCNSVVNPHVAGIGGGILMTIYNRTTKQAVVVDALTAAPASISMETFKNLTEAGRPIGVDVAVPGALRGYREAQSSYGRLSWSQLLQPAIDLCRRGFQVSDDFAQALQDNKKNILASEIHSALFVNSNTSDVYKAKEIFVWPTLGDTLNRLANMGPEDFYSGSIGKSLVQDLKNYSGLLTLQDLESYQVRKFDAYPFSLADGSVIHTTPPPSGGFTLGQILMALSLMAWNTSVVSPSDNSAEALQYHHMIEIMKYSFGDRHLLQDADNETISQVLQYLSKSNHLQAIIANISDTDTYSPDHYGACADLQEGAATSVLFLDKNGDAVVIASSLGTSLSSAIVSPSTDILLNRDMLKFTPAADYTGLEYAPGRRPLSSLSPVVVTDKEGDVKVLIGPIAEANQTITSQVQILARILLTNVTLKEAIDAPRLHHALMPNFIFYEYEFPGVYLHDLYMIGHDLKQLKQYSVVNGIQRDGTGKYWAMLDYRQFQ